ncbi:MAG: carboxypeptidase-like regulatory domain-containing protein [Candidatus Zixiibacteriota bacterium]
MSAVRGTVYLPYELSAAMTPASGVHVRLRGGDFDSSVVTGTTGSFFFRDVPVRSGYKLTFAASLCLSVPEQTVEVLKNDTARVDVTLAQNSGNCYGLPFSGAARVEIDPVGGRTILLYDSAYLSAGRSHPAIVVLNLATGQGSTHEFSDLEDVCDLALISADEVAIYGRSVSAFGVRFFNIATMAASRADVVFETDMSFLGGRLALDDTREWLFATVGRQTLSFPDPVGKVYAVSLRSGLVVDADNDPADGNNAFDDDLVAGALGWAYNIAYDPLAGEILVGNLSVPFPEGPFLTAISLAKWGAFDRDSDLVAPTAGVRKVNMDPGEGFTGFAVDYWDFAQGIGVAGRSQSAFLMVTYETGGTSYASKLRDNKVHPATRDLDHVLKVVPERQTWFMLLDDPSRPDEVRSAIEERELSTLQRHNRYETQLVVDFFLVPRGFAVDAQAERLYVAYRNEPVLEVFDLCRGEDCNPAM